MFFLFIILSIVIIILIFLFSSIEIYFKKIRFTSFKVNKRNLGNDYNIIIKIKFLNFIPIFKRNITKEKLQNKNIKNNIKKLENKMSENKNKFDYKVIKALKYLDFKLDNINLRIFLGLEEADKTAILTGAISGILAIILYKYIRKKDNNYWHIMPVYQNQNLLEINFDGIITLKVINIIYVISNFVFSR